jgi:hypothetical protein
MKRLEMLKQMEEEVPEDQRKIEIRIEDIMNIEEPGELQEVIFL